MRPKTVFHADAAKFREYLGYSKAKSTAQNYALNVNKFLTWTDKPTGELEPDDIIAWFQSLEEAGFSARTIWRYGHALRSFFDVMGMNDMRLRTPIVSFEVPEPKWIPEETEARALVGNVPVLCVGYDLALRVGEVGLLRWSAFNPDTGDIEVRRLKHRGKRNTYILQLDGWCLDVLNEYRGSVSTRDLQDDVMFPMSTQVIQRIFNMRAADMGLTDYTFHSLRHSRITHLAIAEIKEKGVCDELSLSKFAGHLQVDTTRGYVHLASGHLAFKS